jgi:Lrp/AsnC family leucine-responsive transcriptional regulator
VAGDQAFIVKVRVADIDALHRCLGRLRSIRGVARTRTTVVLATRYEMRPHLLEPAEPEQAGEIVEAAADQGSAVT